MLLSLDRLFRPDYLDGSLEQLLLSSQPLSLLIFAKLCAHWLMSALPLIILAPFLGLLFHLSSFSLWILMASLLLGTPILILIGAIGRALTIHVRGGSLMLALLILPLYVPVLILGAGSVALANQGMIVSGQLAWMGVLLILSLLLSPVTVAAALRSGL